MRNDIKILLVLYKKQAEKHRSKLETLEKAKEHFEKEEDVQVIKYINDSIQAFTERLDRVEKHIKALFDKYGKKTKEF